VDLTLTIILQSADYLKVDVLRRWLNVPSGVLIKDVITSNQLQKVLTLTWVRWILAFLLGDFIFMSPSPFEDLSLAKKSWASSKYNIASHLQNCD